MKAYVNSFMRQVLLILLLQTILSALFVLSNTFDKRDYEVNRGIDYAETESIDILQTASQSSEEDENSIYIDEPITNEKSYRLPNTTRPLRYFLHITTNVHRGLYDYNGNCTIEIMVLESTNELVLHARNLYIFQIFIDDLTNHTSMKNLSFKIRDQLLIIYCTKDEDVPASTLKSFIRNHRLRLEIHYSNSISKEFVGFYRITYKTNEGVTIVGASTQFEPIFARSALPCYDEPQLKATFTVRITHGNNYTAISNMPDDGKPITDHLNMTTTTFLETPMMSVYLLAFAVSNFKNASIQNDNLLQRVFLPPSETNLNTTKFLENSIQAMKAFEQLFDIPYLLPKLDHVVLNEILGNGMENWGLITYSGYKIFNSKALGTKGDFDVLTLQTHELVHQWFGNLVTLEWWSYTWLNEGFSTYYSQILMDMLRPEYKILELYQSLSCNEGRNDFEDSVMTKYVEVPWEITSTFNRASYVKAGCVIQMFEHAFGQNVFRRGISKYLKTHAYSTVNENKLFAAIQAELVQVHTTWNYSVHDIMQTWTHSKVLPVVKVTRNYGNQSSIIRLQQFVESEEQYELFWIPLNFVTSSNATFEHTSADFFMPPVIELTVDLKTLGFNLTDDDWLLVNKKGTGYYGVIYDSRNMDLIVKVLQSNHSSIHVQNRIAYFYDISNKSQLKTSVNIVLYLESIKYLKSEENAWVWNAAIPLIEMLVDGFRNDDFAYQDLRDYLLQLVTPIYEQLNKMPDIEFSVQKGALLDNLQSLLCTLDVDSCLLLKKISVLKFIAGEHNAINDTVIELCSAAKVFNVTEYELALDFFVGQSKLKMFTGLGCTRNESLYERLLEKVMDMIGDENNCKNKLITYLDFLTIRKLSARTLSWKVFVKNIPRIVESAPCVDAFVESLNKNLIYIDESHKEELRAFYDFYAKRNGTKGAFNETIVGKNIAKEAIEPKISANVTKWLRNELNNTIDEG